MERCEFCGQPLQYCTECDSEFCINCEGGKKGLCPSCLEELENELFESSDEYSDNYDELDEEYEDIDDMYNYSEEFDGDIEDLEFEEEEKTIH